MTKKELEKLPMDVLEGAAYSMKYAAPYSRVGKKALELLQKHTVAKVIREYKIWNGLIGEDSKLWKSAKRKKLC